MTNYYLWRRVGKAGRCYLGAALVAGGLLPNLALAQAPTWALATANSINSLTGTSGVRAVATDASGNVFVTGRFAGNTAFGNTGLASIGDTDLFVAKYAPATNTWVWAVRAGGIGSDAGLGIAVSGSSIYVTGTITNNAANASYVMFGGTSASNMAVQAGASPTTSGDLVVAKYTDLGSTVALNWTQVAGGTSLNEQGTSIAVQGNKVYVLGELYTNQPNSSGVVFGGSGTTPGTWPQSGVAPSSATADLVVAKYLDQGNAATVAWTQVAGGFGYDYAGAIAVSGTSVYVTGAVQNNLANAGGVVFGGAGTTPGTLAQSGASSTSSTDLVVAKYTDNGATATVNWTQVGGGMGPDRGSAIAVAGSEVYVAGSIFNDTADSFRVVFGGAGTTPGTSSQYGTGYGSIDAVVAKYTDQGSSAALRWTHAAGGSGNDNGFGLTLGNGGRDVYVATCIVNDAANTNRVVFGGTGPVPGTVFVAGTGLSDNADIVVAKYTDQGSAAALHWTQAGGGSYDEVAWGLALVGARLYVAGSATTPATFGSFTLTGLGGTGVSFLGALDLSGVLATGPATSSLGLRLYPNPAAGAAILQGATAHTPVLILDALGRRVASASADASGSAVLPAGLAPGVYLVRAGASTVRWAVE